MSYRDTSEFILYRYEKLPCLAFLNAQTEAAVCPTTLCMHLHDLCASVFYVPYSTWFIANYRHNKCYGEEAI